MTDYVAHKDTDTILFGEQLKLGMEVLLENLPLRNRSEIDSNWCKIVSFHSGQLSVTFVGEYADGTLHSRNFSNTYGWIVKLESIPA